MRLHGCDGMRVTPLRHEGPRLQGGPADVGVPVRQAVRHRGDGARVAQAGDRREGAHGRLPNVIVLVARVRGCCSHGQVVTRFRQCPKCTQSRTPDVVVVQPAEPLQRLYHLLVASAPHRLERLQCCTLHSWLRVCQATGNPFQAGAVVGGQAAERLQSGDADPEVGVVEAVARVPHGARIAGLRNGRKGLQCLQAPAVATLLESLLHALHGGQQRDAGPGGASPRVLAEPVLVGQRLGPDQEALAKRGYLPGLGDHALQVDPGALRLEVQLQQMTGTRPHREG
mmetsp:Transcript_66154/g.207306  ORF Transcript_66154/g.207306 Transcript_66154/m.207306 type:complete len:284 (-) Transcript_66154:54-905(-)